MENKKIIGILVMIFLIVTEISLIVAPEDASQSLDDIQKLVSDDIKNQNLGSLMDQILQVRNTYAQDHNLIAKQQEKIEDIFIDRKLREFLDRKNLPTGISYDVDPGEIARYRGVIRSHLKNIELDNVEPDPTKPDYNDIIRDKTNVRKWQELEAEREILNKKVDRNNKRIERLLNTADDLHNTKWSNIRKLLTGGFLGLAITCISGDVQAGITDDYLYGTKSCASEMADIAFYHKKNFRLEHSWYDLKDFVCDINNNVATIPGPGCIE